MGGVWIFSGEKKHILPQKFRATQYTGHLRQIEYTGTQDIGYRMYSGIQDEQMYLYTWFTRVYRVYNTSSVQGLRQRVQRVYRGKQGAPGIQGIKGYT